MGVRIKRAPLFGVSTRAPDFFQTPTLATSRASEKESETKLGMDIVLHTDQCEAGWVTSRFKATYLGSWFATD